jgi:integrase
MTAAESRRREPKLLDAGGFQPEISSFRLHLAAEGKAAKTVRTYTEAVAWFAAAHLGRPASCTRWEQVGRQDVQRWIVWLLERYSSAYASNQYRALQQFFRWLAAEEELPDPMDGMRPPHVPGKPVPVFPGEDLSRLERTCAGRSFQQRRDAAVIAVFRATGIRLSELAQIRYDRHDPRHSDIDLELREITVHYCPGLFVQVRQPFRTTMGNLTLGNAPQSGCRWPDSRPPFRHQQAETSAYRHERTGAKYAQVIGRHSADANGRPDRRSRPCPVHLGALDGSACQRHHPHT